MGVCQKKSGNRFVRPLGASSPRPIIKEGYDCDPTEQKPPSSGFDLQNHGASRLVKGRSWVDTLPCFVLLSPLKILLFPLQSPMFDGKTPHWYHPKCFFQRSRPTAVGDIAHFDSLRWEDQEKIKWVKVQIFITCKTWLNLLFTFLKFIFKLRTLTSSNQIFWNCFP